MSEHNKADEARKGLIDSVKGKAKEIAGAVTGNDSLTTEGQLEQAQAKERKEANAVDAVADAEAQAARAEAVQAAQHADADRDAVNRAAATATAVAASQQVLQKQVAEEAGRLEAEQQKANAERIAEREVQQAGEQERRDIKFASAHAAGAVDEHRSAVRDQAADQAEADRLERYADKLTDRADLP